MSNVVIYTDLDGTLLDHHTYAFDEALETIKALKDRGIDIARRTVVKYRQQLGIPPARLRRQF